MNCKNCNYELPTNSDYCNACGGKVIRNRLTFKNLFEHFTETFFNYDNKLLRTFIDMFKKPEVVIDTYVQGVRKRYVNPVSFFGIILTINGLNIFLISKFFKKYLDASQMMGDTASAENEATRKMLALSSDFSLEYGSLLFSLLIPLAALVGLIVFYNKRYNYTEHVILYLYSMSMYSILSVIFGLLVLLIVPNSYMSFAIVMYVFIFVYHCYIFKRLFSLSMKQLILKILLFLVVFFIFYIGISILVTILLLITGAINLEDFVPKKN
ncbi:DUF3667 domain-containing protein [Psychroserpens sp. Hel_I_66]|uniref:DUF3667 domain-containing protein n=1 Tax=Psychroserpens sp. Hel_I_66 TaxID=1250004 RepID=UPI000646AE59|nr:DUF3667 domain-containing protein [Psychroserpens sp. Hel_I_66]